CRTALQLDSPAIAWTAPSGVAIRQWCGSSPVRPYVVALDLPVTGVLAIGVPDADTIRVIARDHVSRRRAQTTGAAAADADAGLPALQVYARPVRRAAVRNRRRAGAVGPDQIAFDDHCRIDSAGEYTGAAVA